MTDPVKEQLSACLDGQLPEAELDLLVKQVQRDPRLQQSIARYGLISEVLRTGTSPMPSPGFAARISQAIAAEATDHPQQAAPPAIPRREAPRWVRPVGGAAIAAGVAAVAIMVLQPQINPQPQGNAIPEMAATGLGETVNDNDSYTVPPSTSAAVPAADLAKYVMAHSEYAGPLGRRAVWSSVLGDDESEFGDSIDFNSIHDMDTPADADEAALQPEPSPQRQP